MREDWEAIFDESMPWGFGIDVEQIPIPRQCIAQRSQDALEAYFATYPNGVLYLTERPLASGSFRHSRGGQTPENRLRTVVASLRSKPNLWHSSAS